MDFTNFNGLDVLALAALVILFAVVVVARRRTRQEDEASADAFLFDLAPDLQSGRDARNIRKASAYRLNDFN